ncbi:hypothetical protein SAMN06272771_0701 [Streptomyces sp. Ag82_O1-12]|nr:hypothetical protein SAMN06272771_0701 [Streptomyces sp. Ag82_O1-12]SOD43431.1 hypothetical protein SAMN06272727_0690 [Streptomyces sp. Ag82_G6-1]
MKWAGAPAAAPITPGAMVSSTAYSGTSDSVRPLFSLALPVRAKRSKFP